MSLWSNRLKKYDEVKSFVVFCFLFFKKKLFVHFRHPIQFHMVLLLPLPSTLFLIWTTSTAYMCLRDAVLVHIYTQFGDLISPFRLRWNISPSIYRQGRSQKRGPLHGQLPLPQAAGRKVTGRCVSLRVKVRRAWKKRSFSFSKPYDCHQCCKKRSNTQF